MAMRQRGGRFPAPSRAPRRRRFAPYCFGTTTRKNFARPFAGARMPTVPSLPTSRSPTCTSTGYKSGFMRSLLFRLHPVRPDKCRTFPFPFAWANADPCEIAEEPPNMI